MGLIAGQLSNGIQVFKKKRVSPLFLLLANKLLHIVIKKGDLYMFWGVALVVAGVLLVLSRAGVISGDLWDYILPIILIGIGVKLMLGRKQKS